MITDINLVTIGIILIIVYFFVLSDMYFNSMHDIKGNSLNFIDTLYNIFGMYSNSEDKSPISEFPSEFPSELPSESPSELPSEEKEISSEKECSKNKEKEVFNIDNNVFTYDQAERVCKAYDAELATEKQVKLAYLKGANWCNYGWSADGKALYPIQQKFYDEIQTTSLKNSCGKPGVNGSKFDPRLKFP